MPALPQFEYLIQYHLYLLYDTWTSHIDKPLPLV